MTSPSANAKYDHVYAILRLDRSDSWNTPLDADMIVVKKVVWSKEGAEREVERLNQLNAEKNCVYSWQLTRLEKPSEKGNDSDSAELAEAEGVRTRDA